MGATKRKQLPERIMLDAGVIIRALEHRNPLRKKDPRVQDCRTLWESALSESRVLIPSITVLEFLVGDGVTGQFPMVRSVEHVGFTYQVAEQMAVWAKPDVLKRLASDTKVIRRIVRYDALIVGMAAFHKASVLVSLDADMKPLGELAGVRVSNPTELLRGTQKSLF